MISRFPFIDRSEARGWDSAPTQMDLTDAAILVVDDSEMARGLLVEQLSTGGYKNIEVVGDGFEALEAIPRFSPELIITDLIMPKMNGFELCRRIRGDHTIRQISILAQTESSDPEHRVQALASGATEVFTKAYYASELLHRVRIVLERGRLINRLTEFQQRTAEDLQQAAATQAALLPSPGRLAQLGAAFPLVVASHYEASVGLGGDIWGIHQASARRVLIFNADFAGHGVGAAFNTARLHSFIHTGAGEYGTPAGLLARLNRLLCEVLPTGQYATMFCAIMDFRANTLEYASAASPPQLLRNAGDQPFTILQQPGFPLGVTRDASFEDLTAPFLPGATLLLFSDALIETPPPPDAAFTVEGLCAFVDAIPTENGPQCLCDRVLRRLFSSIQAKPEDDLTLVAAHHLRKDDRP